MQVGKRVRELRTEQKLSMKELAARAGTSYSTVSRLETNNIYPRVETLVRIATALDASVSALLQGEEDAS